MVKILFRILMVFNGSWCESPITGVAGRLCRLLKPAAVIGLFWVLALAPRVSEAELDSGDLGVWVDGYAGGFDPSTEVLTLSGGIGIGVEMFGGVEQHDLALLNLGYGWLIGPARFTNHWFRGQLEIRAELFGGVEFSPSDEWLVGGAGQLRYNFLTGTRWVPFAGAGAGVLATSIEEPDLSGTFEFNLQLIVGTHCFLKENLALTAETRFMHISCAGISSPNLGVNDFIGYLGVSWFF